MGPAIKAQPHPTHAPQAILKLVRVDPVAQDVVLVFRVPDALDLSCPMQLRIGDLSVQFREVQDANARTARFVLSRELYQALDNRQHQTVISSCQGQVANTITYPRLTAVSTSPEAILKLVRVDPVGQDVVLVFRVPDALDLSCPMQLRIGDLSVQFREVQDANARTARFVLSRELYQALDNRQHQTVISSCQGQVANTITYPSLSRVRS